MGWPLFGFAILSAGYATWRHRPVDIVLLSYAVVNYIAISSTTSEVLFYPRYTLPIIVVLAILAGRALAELTQRLQLRGATSVVAATILVIWPASMALGNTYALTQTDTRTLAKQWFDQHVPAGSRVLIEGSKIAASRLSVPLADTPESLARRTTYWKTREPRQAKYLEIMRRVHPGGGYQLEFMQIGSIADLSEYVARGVEFVVVRPDHFMGSRRSKGDGMRLLNSLRTAPDAVMVKRFEAEAGRSLGPTIEVYRVRPAPPVGR
jgi:hypothetical protein